MITLSRLVIMVVKLKAKDLISRKMHVKHFGLLAMK